jgi:hypothetical protein
MNAVAAGTAVVDREFDRPMRAARARTVTCARQPHQPLGEIGKRWVSGGQTEIRNSVQCSLGARELVNFGGGRRPHTKAGGWGSERPLRKTSSDCYRPHSYRSS